MNEIANTSSANRLDQATFSNALQYDWQTVAAA